MNSYNVTFAGDWGWIGTTVVANDDEDAIDAARYYLNDQSGIPWEVICMMPHVEAEYVGEL